MEMMDRWTFEHNLLTGDKEDFDVKAIKEAYAELYEAHRVLKNTLNAVSAVITIN